MKTRIKSFIGTVNSEVGLSHKTFYCVEVQREKGMRYVQDRRPAQGGWFNNRKDAEKHLAKQKIKYNFI